ncbi:hypothetical protein TNCV_3907441 [Trichonephila clavipes]|nr:hypothetical protein TNCV_3907441 [Trichonephila clavipes]
MNRKLSQFYYTRICSTWPPPQGKTFQTSDKSSNGRVQHVRMYGGYFLRIASFSSDRLDGPDRYTRDFKYPHNQKFAGVKSGDRGGHGYLQRLLTILSSRTSVSGMP